ncbi:MAG: hypothetical protein J6Y55_06495 [Bacteroidales bacterium]|nr:hypothetical protein [Bacteroidales bacterium]
MVGNKKITIPDMKKIGRITQPIAKAIKKPAADIYLSKYWIKHNERYHSKEIKSVGMTVEQFIIWVVENFNQIRAATGESFTLIVYNGDDTSMTATIDITIQSNDNYEVKTAQPRRIESLANKQILWEK